MHLSFTTIPFDKLIYDSNDFTPDPIGRPYKLTVIVVVIKYGQQALFEGGVGLVLIQNGVGKSQYNSNCLLWTLLSQNLDKKSSKNKNLLVVALVSDKYDTSY